jgi:predicted permease
VFYLQDVRYAFRLLAKSPLFSILTVVVLAGGLAVAIFTFSFLHTAMLKPLPVRQGESVVRLMTVTAAGENGYVGAGELARMRPRITTLTEVGAYAGREYVVGLADGRPRRSIQAVAAEPNVFDVTRTRPMLGRGFRPDDGAPGAEPVVVLNEWAWRVVFGSDRRLVEDSGTIRLNGAPTRVIGVMPAGYGFPVAAEAWVPLPPELLDPSRAGEQRLEAYARLAPGADAKKATAELSALLGSVRTPARDSSVPTPVAMTVRSFPMAQIGEEGPLALAVLNTLAGLILLLACINVTNLLLARANERVKETAVRLALGAPRARLVLQSMWESVLLCLAGGVVATALAVWGLGAVDAWARTHLEGNLPFWWVWGFDRTVLLSAGIFVTAAIAVLGAVVGARSARAEVRSVLQEGGTRGGGRREGRVMRALVVTQVSVVSVLMFFGCMAWIVADRVVHADLGFDTRRLLTTSVDLPDERYPDAAVRGRFFQGLLDDLERRPELDGVLLRDPLAELETPRGVVEIADPAAAVSPRAHVLPVLGSTEILGAAPREGRPFDTRDADDAVPTAIVSRSFAARAWPGGTALGRQIRLSGLDEKSSRTVVGVVDDVLLGNPLSRRRSSDAVYVPLRQSGAAEAVVTFRHRGDRVAATTAFLAALSSVDPLIVPSNVASFEEVTAKMSLIARSVAALFGLCFGFAVLLAASGTYGLMARSIVRRTRDLGVRRALGATDSRIVAMLLREGGRQLGIGALFAMPLTLLTAWGFSRYFPVGLAISISAAVGVSAAVGALVLAATWLPARRAVAVPLRDALGRE